MATIRRQQAKIAWRTKPQKCVLCKKPADTLAHPQVSAHRVKALPRGTPGICMQCALEAAVDLLRDKGIDPLREEKP